MSNDLASKSDADLISIRRKVGMCKVKPSFDLMNDAQTHSRI